MSNGKAMIIHLITRLIKRHSVNEWIFSKTEVFRRKCECWIKISLILT